MPSLQHRFVRYFKAPRKLLGLIVVLLSALGLTGKIEAQTVAVGKATYRTDLPPDADGKPRRLMNAKPSVSDRIKSPAPTNDWCSSLVWPSGTEHSLTMFPHPLAIKANESGLGLGYNPIADVTDSLKDGKLFQKGSNYKFPYRESMTVGLTGLASPNCVLDGQSDWTVTALWQSESNRLRACLLYTSPSPRDQRGSRMPSSA